MLDLVTAVGFRRVLESGRTSPVLVEAERANGDMVEVVAKLSSGHCGLGGLVREAMAAMLAADLGLPTPEPFLVDFPVSFDEIVPAHYPVARQMIRDSISPTYGSGYLLGLHAYPADRPIPPALLDKAAEIVIFDGACRNVDRWHVKPNCLTDGQDTLVIIDHELALTDDPTLGSSFNPAPWQAGGMSSLLQSDRPHILLKAVKGKKVNLDRLHAAWSGLESGRFAEYVAAIPPGWDPSGLIAQGIQDYFNQILHHLDDVFQEGRRMLS